MHEWKFHWAHTANGDMSGMWICEKCGSINRTNSFLDEPKRDMLIPSNVKHGRNLLNCEEFLAYRLHRE